MFIDCFKKSFEFSIESVYIILSIGISIFLRDGDGIDDFLKYVDVVMY